MHDSAPQFAEVALPVPLHGTFTYRIPEALKGELQVGSRVEVPWGSRLMGGFVVGLSASTELEPKKVRDLRSLLDDDLPALVPGIIELCLWAASYYLAPPGEMLRVALPANMAPTGKRLVGPAGDRMALSRAVESGVVTESDAALWETLDSGGAVAIRSLAARSPGSRSAIRRLVAAELATVRDEFRDAAGVRYDRHAILVGRPAKTTAKQRDVVDRLESAGGSAAVGSLIASGASAGAIETLARSGAVRIDRRPRRHGMESFYSRFATAGERFEHTPQQRAAIDRVLSSFGRFSPFLLEGVTGSGKTEVYIELMREAVRRGEQAILLVPEISLTPMLAARLHERFGDRIAILHSGLTPSEKYDQWWRARRGAVEVAIGPRSAVFTPFERLGLVIVDEEGDGAYKQDETPRYNARDLAVVRAQMCGIPVVLGSATPSLESRENAETGKYELIRLESRVESRPLPEVEIIDLRREKGEKEDRGFVIFSAPVREELARVFGRGEQAMILMNRRGYAPFLLCRECENDFHCRDCSVSLTVHKRAGLLVCHYCGFRRPLPPVCPQCSGEVLQPIGFGTEKVEERFRRYFPETSVAVLDRDSTRRKGELVRILDRFRRGDVQALIGTQMISKGHDFPNVTLTAVLNADAILGFPDFRSAEKTFYLLTQVAGRSGRGEREGKVLIQTAFPHHYAIGHAIEHDYEGFYREEIEFRRRFHYPPATAMIAIVFRGADEGEVERAATEAGRLLEPQLARIADVRVQGPAPAPLARIKGVYRFQILLRSARRAALRQAVSGAIAGREWRGVDTVIDVDPMNIL
jgi:primosomal protein N' (replication factor Y) (superfamily II helicase)